MFPFEYNHSIIHSVSGVVSIDGFMDRFFSGIAKKLVQDGVTNIRVEKDGITFEGRQPWFSVWTRPFGLADKAHIGVSIEGTSLIMRYWVSFKRLAIIVGMMFSTVFLFLFEGAPFVQTLGVFLLGWAVAFGVSVLFSLVAIRRFLKRAITDEVSWLGINTFDKL